MSTDYYQVAQRETASKDGLGDTEFFKKLMKGIYGPRAGDARVIIDAQDSSKGCGKTGLAITLAKILAKVFGYDFGEDDVMLSGQEYLRRIREHPGPEQPSVIVLDELAGAGAGHAYREMSSQNVELGNWWQLMRKKRVVSLVTLPHWSKASKAMRREAEFRLHCLKEPIGYFKAYEVTTSFGDGDIRTRGLDDERIAFPDVPSANVAEYDALDTRKDELLASATMDADDLTDDEGEETIEPDEARRQTKIEIAQRLRDGGLSTREVASHVDQSHTWVVENTD